MCYDELHNTFWPSFGWGLVGYFCWSLSKGYWQIVMFYLPRCPRHNHIRICWICRTHEQSTKTILQPHACRSWTILSHVKLQNFDILSKASNDATFYLFICPFCCKVTVLCLNNVIQVHTSIKYGDLLLLLPNLKWEPTSFVAPICKTNNCYFIEEEMTILQSPRSGWSHPIPHINK